MTRGILDDCLDQIESDMLDQAVQQKKMNPILDKQLWVVQKIDGKITWFENKLKELEEEKQLELRKMGDLLELAMKQTHELKNGYTVKPDNKRKLEVKNLGDFLKWLKINREPQDVFSFLEESIKKTSLTRFCNKEANNQRTNGELEPKIDGIKFGVVTYRRLTTENKKEKKK